MEERINAGQSLRLKCRGQVYVDLMANEANTKYGAFPERLYIIYRGKIEYFGGIGPFGYTLPPVRDWLQKYVNSNRIFSI